MERPANLKGQAAEYADYLENKLSLYSSKKTKVRSYLALKKIIDDLNNLIQKGIEVNNPETGDVQDVDIISDLSLMAAGDKSFDRIFKFIEKIGTFNEELNKMEQDIDPDEIKIEKVKLKGKNSVEARIFGED